MSFARCSWLNAPAAWHLDAETLHAVTDDRTDFWRETHYGFTRDSGHFYGCPVEGEFTAQLRIQAQYDALYDQAGIMVRIGEADWIKAGMEKSDGRALLSSVLTIGQSDWATSPYDNDPADFWMRVTISDGVIRLQVSADGKLWPLVRLAPFPRVAAYLVGPMCCTPERAGLAVRFSSFAVGPASARNLHDLS